MRCGALEHAKPHTAACRARVEEAMTGDEIGRAQLAETLLRRDKMILRSNLLECGDASRRVLRLQVDIEFLLLSLCRWRWLLTFRLSLMRRLT